MAEESKPAITFSVLRQIYRDEKNTAILVKLADGFYKELAEFMKKSNDNAKKTRSFDAVREHQHITTTAKELLEIRQRKIVTGALLLGTDAKKKLNIVAEEEELLDSVVSLLANFRKKHGFDWLFGEKETRRITLKEDIPEYVGKDEKTYGPYKKGETHEIAAAEASYLVENGLAEDE